MKKITLLLLTACLALTGDLVAQNAFNNATNLFGSSDNTGDSANQTGTEVLNSTPGMGVMFEFDGSFEHVGQFYVADNGIWNRDKGATTFGTDYFGYVPIDMGISMPYLGVGIQGASSKNGGKGAGQPVFGHLQLNSTGLFPVEGGMYIAHSLAFNANGPGRSSVITTPNSSSPNSPRNAVIFASTAVISGANDANYIDGYASVTGPSNSFSLPVGDPTDTGIPLHSLTVTNTTTESVTTRYLRTIQHVKTSLGAGIGSVSSIGDWPIAAPAGTRLIVRLPALSINSTEAINLRMVGWNGGQWVDLSGSATAGACVGEGCPLQGTLQAGITDLAIGSTSHVFSEEGIPDANSLFLWPNPTQGIINLQLSAGKTAQAIQVFDLQGRSVIQPAQVILSVDASPLSLGTYVVEVQTVQGQILRKQFVKQQ